MKFDDWMLTKDKSYVPTDDSMQLRLLRECWFSRDAEVAELKQLIRRIFEETPPYHEDGTCVFSDRIIQKWKEIAL